jgi:hypothetical protein
MRSAAADFEKTWQSPAFRGYRANVPALFRRSQGR